MGLATIDPKELTNIHKIPMFGVNRSNSRQDNNKIYTIMYGHLKRCVRMTKHFFVNFDDFKWLYRSQN